MAKDSDLLRAVIDGYKSELDEARGREGEAMHSHQQALAELDEARRKLADVRQTCDDFAASKTAYTATEVAAVFHSLLDVPDTSQPEPTAVWCVLHRDGWCATKDNHEPAEGAWSVPTRCGHYVTLPGGYDRRQPTCPDCGADRG